MKRLKLDWVTTSSTRLALSYLGVIMVLSMAFSIIFYRTSTASFNNVGLQTQMMPDDGLRGSASTSPSVGSVSLTNGAAPITITASNVASLNAQLRRQVHAIRLDLVRRLVMLNLGALVVGALLSYYLARRTLKPIESAMEAQSRFSSDASHELRTPLTALRARNEVALRNANLTLAQAKDVIASSVEQTKRLEKLSDGLLRLSRGSKEKSPKAPVSLSEIAGDALNHIVEPAQAKRIDTNDSVPDIKVLGNADNLVQIVTILLDNAVKYSSRGSTIYLEGGSEGKRGWLSVCDQGAGIRATDLPHIFERFYRADYARTKHGQHGYGLGLAIAKELIAQNDGEITVKSTLGEGATFTIKLPLA